MPQPDANSLNRYTSGSLIARNMMWSLLGQIVPWLFAIVAIPFLVRGYGVDKFGLLTLFWVVIGYFSLFDLGMGRALTKIVAERLGAGKTDGIPAVVWTAMLLMALLGVASAAAVILLTPWLVKDVLNIPDELQSENMRAFYLLSLSIPVIITSSGLRGLLEAMQRFRLVNFIRIPLGIYSFMVPLAILPFSTSLVPVVLALLAGRIVAWLAHLAICLGVMPALRRRFSLERASLRPLLQLGSWMTVSNVISPLMTYMDRFLIGSMISVAAVAYYSTPSEVVTKFLIVPGALVAVLFPAFAACYPRDPQRAARLFDRGTVHVMLILFPLILIVVTLAKPGLDLWVGEDFASQGAVVMQWLAAGVLLNALAQIPFALVQGVGRPDLSAKLHMVELPLYITLAWWLIGSFGIQGAAIAWFTRVGLDMLMLFIFSGYLLPATKSFLRRLVPSLTGALGLMLLGGLLQNLIVKLVFLAVVAMLFVPLVWLVYLTQRERDMVKSRVKFIPIFN